MSDGPDRPQPIPDALSQPWWDAVADGRLLIQRCTACASYQFYPRAHCTACFVPGPVWVEAAGTGRLHTFTVVHRTPNAEFAGAPYAFAIVELDEGVRLATTIVDADLDRLACEDRVRLVPGPLPCFTTTEER